MSIQEYKPLKTTIPTNSISIISAWKGIELIIEDILDRFKIERNSCVEFGVEFGYSTVALSSYFTRVIGVDTFEGDIHTAHKGDHYEDTKNKLSSFSNIQLVKSDYKDWIKQNNERFNFSHVDIVHNYEQTYECGLWAVQHSDCAIFHDTESFPEVKRAVIDIAKVTGKNLFNYPHCYGLGIIV